jgi:hypothetical protein
MIMRGRFIGSVIRGSGSGSRLSRKSKDLHRGDRGKAEENRGKTQCVYRRDAECAERGNDETRPALRLWQAGAQPFDSALPNLSMNRPAGRFTSSAATDSTAKSRRDACLPAGRPAVRNAAPLKLLRIRGIRRRRGVGRRRFRLLWRRLLWRSGWRA